MQATARIYIQKAPAKQTLDGRHPVKLCITHKGIRKYFSLRDKVKENSWMYLSEDDIVRIWPENKQQQARGKYKDIRNEYDRIVREAGDIINNMPVFSFGKFEHEFLNTVTSWDSFNSAIIDHIKALTDEGRFSYASSFESLLRSVWEFHNKRNLTYTTADNDIKPVTNRVKVDKRYKMYLSGKKLNFVDITSAWLTRFDKWMQDQGKSKTTIGIYMRNMRVLFNIAIKKKKVKADYPFHEYKPKKASGRKLALSAYQISKIADHQTADPREEFYKDIFMFSFLANGMNISDIARLKYSNIDGNCLYFVREKTKRKDEQTEIRVPITKQMKIVIDRHSNRAIGHDAYIFPILEKDWPERRIYMEIKQAIKMLNRHIRKIAKAAGITEKISSYTARHSWATISKNSGASTEYIKEALGHSNVMVTENYLKSFEDVTRQEHSEKVEQQVYKTEVS